MKKQLLTLLIGAAAIGSAWAVPARRGFVKAMGPDGEPIAVQLVGDEFGHYTADSEGRMMVRQGDRFVYASEEMTEAVKANRRQRFAQRNKAYKARRNAPGAIGKFPDSTFPCIGKQKAIVVLVEYQDQKFELGDHAHDYFTDMLNKKGFSEYNATGCVNEYFLDSSNGQFDCEFDLYGPVTLKYNMAHYGGNDSNGNDKAPEEMVIEACQQLDATVDFKQYDRDNDGIIDNVYVIYAGRGEASDLNGEYPNTVWPHSWDVSHLDYSFDGVKLATYGCSNEWEDLWDSDGWSYEVVGANPDGIGTFVHEFSHVMGLPDLYHTESSSADYTPGEWSVLDYGPYNNNGRTPPAYSAFERNAMGWLEPVELTAESGELSVSDITTSNAAYSITNPMEPNEFYLIECRNQTGWDKYIPGEGMLIWHVDYDAEIWLNNSVNNSKSHQRVDLIEADGVASKPYGREVSDAFPYGNVKSYTPKWWNRSGVGFTINNITRNPDGSVSFAVEGNNGGGEIGGGNDHEGDYYTVAQVQLANLDNSKITVRGYVVGYANNAFSDNGVMFTSTGCNVNTNIVMADSADELFFDNCIPVQLPKGNVRDELNLRDNPGNLGKLIEVDGTLAAYFSYPGLRSASAWRLIEEEQDGIEEIETGTNGADVIYDLSGRRVASPSHPGLYIVNGRKVLY